jgi:hypothetical protein
MVDLSDELRPHVEHFFNAKPGVAIAVVLAFEIECGSGSPQADLETEIRSRWVPEKRVDMVASAICGLVKRQVDKLLEQRKAAILSRDEFHQATLPIVRKFVEKAILHSFAPFPTQAEVDAFLPRTFVRQLQIVEKDLDDQMDAISSLLRASHDRTIWGQSGDVEAGSLDELDRCLLAAWKNLKTIAFLNAAARTDIEKGQLLLAHCLQFQTSLDH